MKSDSKTSAVLAIIENLHRRDLNVFEEASAIASLIEIYHLTQEQIAAKLSMTQAAVANKLRLLKLSEEEKSLILSGKLTERHARALLRIKNPEERLKILHRILNSGLNVKQTEEFIEEKVGQMLMFAFHGCEFNEQLKTQIDEFHLGGVIHFARNIINPEQVLKLNKDLQE